MQYMGQVLYDNNNNNNDAIGHKKYSDINSLFGTASPVFFFLDSWNLLTPFCWRILTNRQPKNLLNVWLAEWWEGGDYNTGDIIKYKPTFEKGCLKTKSIFFFYKN